MSNRLKEVIMEDIPDITSDTVDRLRKSNINSVYQLAVQIPSELAPGLTMDCLISGPLRTLLEMPGRS